MIDMFDMEACVLTINNIKNKKNVNTGFHEVYKGPFHRRNKYHVGLEN